MINSGSGYLPGLPTLVHHPPVGLYVGGAEHKLRGIRNKSSFRGGTVGGGAGGVDDLASQAASQAKEQEHEKERLVIIHFTKHISWSFYLDA